MKTVWSNQIKDIFKERPKEDKEIFLNIVSLFMYDKLDERMSNLYKILGRDNFYKVLNILGGVNIQIPTKEEYEEINTIALCYYYKEIKGKTWDEIRRQVPFEVNSIKYGKIIACLSNKARKEIEDNFYKIDEINNEDGSL